MNRILRTAAMLVPTASLFRASAGEGTSGRRCYTSLALARQLAHAFFRALLRLPALGNPGLRRSRRSTGMVDRVLARLDGRWRRDRRSVPRHDPGGAVVGQRRRARQRPPAPQLGAAVVSAARRLTRAER